MNYNSALRLRIIERAVIFGADINKLVSIDLEIPENSRETATFLGPPISLACLATRNLSIMSRLIQLGAKCSYGATGRRLDIIAGSDSCFTLSPLFSSAITPTSIRYPLSILIMAASGAEEDIAEPVSLALIHGSSCYFRQEGTTTSVLHIAAHLGQANLLCRLAVQFRMDVNRRDHNGKTPAHYAVDGSAIRPIETLNVLAALGADLDLEDARGHTPFYDVVNAEINFQKFALFTTLLSSFVNPNHKPGETHHSPLQLILMNIARATDESELILMNTLQLLIDYGAVRSTDDSATLARTPDTPLEVDDDGMPLVLSDPDETDDLLYHRMFDAAYLYDFMVLPGSEHVAEPIGNDLFREDMVRVWDKVLNRNSNVLALKLHDAGYQIQGRDTFTVLEAAFRHGQFSVLEFLLSRYTYSGDILATLLCEIFVTWTICPYEKVTRIVKLIHAALRPCPLDDILRSLMYQLLYTANKHTTQATTHRFDILFPPVLHVNHTDEASGYTPLHYLAKIRTKLTDEVNWRWHRPWWLGFAVWLLQRGADPNIRDRDGMKVKDILRHGGIHGVDVAFVVIVQGHRTFVARHLPPYREHYRERQEYFEEVEDEEEASDE